LSILFPILWCVFKHGTNFIPLSFLYRFSPSLSVCLFPLSFFVYLSVHPLCGFLTLILARFSISFFLSFDSFFPPSHFHSVFYPKEFFPFTYFCYFFAFSHAKRLSFFCLPQSIFCFLQQQKMFVFLKCSNVESEISDTSPSHGLGLPCPSCRRWRRTGSCRPKQQTAVVGTTSLRTDLR